MASTNTVDNNTNIEFMAYSWEPVNRNLKHIVPFHWLKLKDYDDINAMADKANAATRAMPDGHKILFSWNIHDDIDRHADDHLIDSDGEVAGCHTASGRFQPYQGVWWHQGVERVRQRFQHFFQRYAETGGQVDFLVVDFEGGTSYWHLYHLAAKKYECGIRAYLNAVEADPRFAAVGHQIGLQNLQGLVTWQRDIDDLLRWDMAMYIQVAQYLNQAIYQPMIEYFPAAKLSNYGNFYQQSHHDLPDTSGIKWFRHGDGIHVGTHQSRAFYGTFGALGNTDFEGVTPSRYSAFNMFRYEINQLKVMAASSQVPISPWISHKPFDLSLLRDNDYYQEMIFHMALTGVTQFLYWNPHGINSPARSEDDLLVNESLRRIQNIVSELSHRTANNQAYATTLSSRPLPLTPWSQNYVLTEAKIANKRLWRFTPRLGEDETLETTLVSRDPVEFNVDGEPITIKNARIKEYSPRISKLGYWLVEKD